MRVFSFGLLLVLRHAALTIFSRRHCSVVLGLARSDMLILSRTDIYVYYFLDLACHILVIRTPHSQG